MHLPRRSFLRVSSFVLATGTLARLAAQQPAATPPPTAAKAPPKPPALDLEMVQAVVGQSHRSLEAVTALVDETPLLVNARWDWGGGDFETALEAAAHTGRREIAEFLLSRGARPSFFAAGMLGQLELVKAFLAVDPKAHEIAGPHGWTLLHCAKQGGERAKPVYDYLLAQGVPEVFQRPLRYVWPEGTAPAKAG
ncbi:hypothetical protein MASR2M8_12100 [Opitutaceae bacterium]